MFPAYLLISPYLQIYRSVSPDLQICIVTPQTPFESVDEETTFTVDKMVGMRWNKGSRENLVRWEGSDKYRPT